MKIKKNLAQFTVFILLILIPIMYFGERTENLNSKDLIIEEKNENNGKALNITNSEKYLLEPILVKSAEGNTLIDHPPIDINGEIELSNFPSKEGSGTENDPYIIKNLKIDANQESSGIYITNIESHLIIKDNLIINPKSHVHQEGCIMIRYSSNLLIKNNTLSGGNILKGGGDGIWIIGSSNINIIGNRISNTSSGIVPYESTDSIISGNTFQSCYNAIWRDSLFWATGFQIWGNNFIDKGFFDHVEGSTEDNDWDNGVHGNYWDDYPEKYPSASNNGIIWNTPYVIFGTENTVFDYFPLVQPYTKPPAPTITSNIDYVIVGEEITIQWSTSSWAIEYMIFLDNECILTTSGSSFSIIFNQTNTVEIALFSRNNAGLSDQSNILFLSIVEEGNLPEDNNDENGEEDSNGGSELEDSERRFEFLDDFNSGILEEWKIKRGTWTANNGYLRSMGYVTWGTEETQTSEIGFLLDQPINTENLNLSFRFQYEAPFTSGIRGQNIHIIFYQNETHNFRLQIVNEGDGPDRIEFAKIINQERTRIADTYATWNCNTMWHDGKIQLDGDQFRFYLDGDIVLNVTDTEGDVENFLFSEVSIKLDGWVHSSGAESYRNIDDFHLIWSGITTPPITNSGITLNLILLNVLGFILENPVSMIFLGIVILNNHITKKSYNQLKKLEKIEKESALKR